MNVLRTAPLATEREAMAYLRVSREAIQRFRRAADPIPHLRAGRRYLYDLAEVREWALRQARTRQDRP